MTTLTTFPYAQLQATDSVTGKIMLTDCADKDAFYRLRISRPTTLYEGSTVYDSNSIFFDNDIQGSASITGPGNNAAMTLSVTGSTPGDYAARQSHFYAHYQPGKSFLAYFSFSFGPAVAGVIKRVGLYDVDNSNANNPLNGILLDQTTSGLTWRVYKGDGTSQSTIQSNWNVDPLNGSGPSGINLTTSNVERNLLGFIDLEWLGVGRIRVGFFLNGVPVICHTFNNVQFSEPYLNNPYLPIRYEIRRVSGSLSANFTIICCTIISEGGFQTIGVARALQSPFVSINNSAKQSLIAFRLQSGFSRSTINLVSVEIASNIGGNANAYYSTYLWIPSSAGAVPAVGWANVSTNIGGTGSIVEYNTSTTMYTTMSNDIISNSGKCIQVDQGAISSIAKSSFQYLSKSLVQAQSSIDKSNRDVFVVVVDNTTPNSRSFSAIVSWREL